MSRNSQNSMHQLPLVAVVFLIIAILVVGLLYVKGKIISKQEKRQETALMPNLQEIPLFSQTLAEAGIAADHIGFHGFSPDGKYFFFTTFTQGKDPGNEAHLLRLADNTIQKLPGIPERSFSDSRVIQLFDFDGNTVLFFPKTNTTKKYAVDESAFAGFLSPDETHYAINTAHGIKVIDLESDAISQFSSGQYDGAYAWFSDGKRMLGYKETDENLFEAGKGRALGIWHMDTGLFEPLPQFSIKQKSIRYIEWLKQDEVARVNAGWDDGSYDYLVDIKKGTLADIGDTSGALMGGIRADHSLELFAVVRPEFQSMLAHAILYTADLKQLHNTNLPSGYLRENMQIIDKNTLLYIRKTLDSNKEQYRITKNELVRLDLRTGAETVVQELATNNFASLSITPDHKAWVVTIEDQFISGNL